MRIGKRYNHSKYITTQDINQCIYIYKFTLVCVNSMIYVLGPKITKKLTTRYCIHAYNTQFYPNCNHVIQIPVSIQVIYIS